MATWTEISTDPYVTAPAGGVVTFLASGAIKKGQVCSYAATGVSWSVGPSAASPDTLVAGVAMHDAASGASVTILTKGIAYCVAEAAVDAGGAIASLGGTTAGAIGPLAALAATTTAGIIAYVNSPFGMALIDIASAGSGPCYINPRGAHP